MRLLLLISFASLLIAVVLLSTAYAQTPLSLSDAIQIALENHPDVAIEDQTLLKSKMVLENARSELFPRLDLILNNRYTETIEEFEPVQISFDLLGTAYTLSPTKDVPDYQSDISLQVTERLFTGGRVLNTINSAKLRVTVADSQKVVRHRAIILSTIKAYWELKRAYKMVEIEKEKVGQSETILRVARAKYEKGVISGLERAKAEVEVINNREDLLQAETTRRIAEDRLLKEMGIIGTGKEYSLILKDEPVYDFSRLDDEVIEETIDKALSLRPEVKQIEAHIQANKANVRVARADYYPQVDLMGEYNWIGYSKDNLDESWRDIDRNYWLVMLKLNLNLFEGFATRSKVNQAKAELVTAQLEFKKQQQMITQDVREAYNTLIGAAERVNILQENIVLAEKNLKAALRQFELGAATINQVAEYNLSVADVRKRYINALIDFEIAKAELKWASGKEIP